MCTQASCGRGRSSWRTRLGWSWPAWTPARTPSPGPCEPLATLFLDSLGLTPTRLLQHGVSARPTARSSSFVSRLLHTMDNSGLCCYFVCRTHNVMTRMLGDAQVLHLHLPGRAGARGGGAGRGRAAQLPGLPGAAPGGVQRHLRPAHPGRGAHKISLSLFSLQRSDAQARQSRCDHQLVPPKSLACQAGWLVPARQQRAANRTAGGKYSPAALDSLNTTALQGSCRGQVLWVSAHAADSEHTPPGR